MHLKWTVAAAAVLVASGAAAQDCASLTEAEIDGAQIDAAETVDGVCRVTVTVDGSIGVEVRLPAQDTWNGKFNGVGNGAFAGFINAEAMEAAVARGYAAGSTDTGHVGHPVEGAPPYPGFDASWALNEDGTRNLEAIENFGHRGIHRMTEVGKALVAAFYGQDPEYSYFTGCSNGGQMALSEAQRYPHDYDGIVAGAPANHPTAMWPGEIYPATLARQIDIPALVEKLPAVTEAAVAQCDMTDGVEDGLIGDPTQCDFDATSVEVLTEDEARLVNLTYEGLKHPETGEQVWPGFEPGSEAEWAGHLNPYFVQLGYLSYMVFQDPAWQFDGFDITDPEDFAAVEEANEVLAPLLSATDPDLSPYAEAGGKLIMWHGWNDQNIAPQNSINYVSAVRDSLGSEAEDTVRLFMLPGLQHCEGGPGFTEFDALAALEDWVEEGEAPQTLTATSPEKELTRPFCAFPLETVHTGGDIADPANYTCE